MDGRGSTLIAWTRCAINPLAATIAWPLLLWVKSTSALAHGLCEVGVGKEQAARQRVVLGGYQAVQRQHRLRVTVDDRHRLGLAHIGQADETDALRVLAHRVRQLLAGLEPLGRRGEGLAATAQDQVLEGVIGARPIIPRI